MHYYCYCKNITKREREKTKYLKEREKTEILESFLKTPV